MQGTETHATVQPIRERKRNAAAAGESSDSDLDLTGAPRDEDSDDDEMGKIPFFRRDKGPKREGLLVRKPSDPLFDRLTIYWFYRLLRRETKRDANVMLDANRRIKALTLAVGPSSKFTGDDPVLIFAFLTG